MKDQEKENKRIIEAVTLPGRIKPIQVTAEGMRMDAVIKKVRTTYLLACPCGEMKNSDTNIERQKEQPCTREGCGGSFIWSYAQTAKVPLQVAP